MYYSIKITLPNRLCDRQDRIKRHFRFVDSNLVMNSGRKLIGLISNESDDWFIPTFEVLRKYQLDTGFA